MRSKKGETVADTIEKKHESHPFLYGFSVVVLVITVVTFIGSPVAGRLQSMGSVVFGTYDGKEISYYPGNYYDQQKNYIAEQVRRSGDTETTAAQVRYIWQQAFDQTVLHVSVLMQTDRAGMQISDDRLDKELLSYPSYQENGKFSEELYNKASLSEKISTRKLVRDQMKTTRFYNDILGSQHASTAEKDGYKALARAERSFSFVSFPFSEYPAEEIAKYAAANTLKFRKAKLSRILVKSGQKEAEEIRKKLSEKTSSFEELAKAHSKDSYAEKGGDMGWRYAYDLEADFETEKKDLAEGLFQLKSGELSKVLKGSYGWMILRCDADPVQPDLSDAATQDVVKSYLLRYERGKVEDFCNEKAGKFSRTANESGFDKALKEAKLTAASTDWFPMNLSGIIRYKTIRTIPDTVSLSSAQYSEEFFQRAFALSKDQTSAPVVLDDQIVVLKLIGERKAASDQDAALDYYYQDFMNQSLQTDLQNELTNPKKLKNNFDAVFDNRILKGR
jgi:peptidyl-prolyl cis-trans isomerase D